jgi:hypothetical protein
MLNQVEKDAFLNAFDHPPDVSLRKIVTPHYIVLMLLFISAFTVVQIFKSIAIEHYSLIHHLNLRDAEALIRSKAIMSFMGLISLAVVYLLGKGFTMMSFVFLMLITNGFFDDFTARLSTPGALEVMSMNLLGLLRIGMVIVIARISYVSMMRSKFGVTHS